MMKDILRVRAVYKGDVQGVGFRFTARNMANDMGLTGFAENLSDGNVLIVAEGPEEDLKTFLERVENDMAYNIKGKSLTWLPATGEFQLFGIRF